MATRVGLAKIRMTPFDRPTPKTPSLVHNSGTYLKCELSYGKFCVKISNFPFPWQLGVSLANFAYTVKLADPENPLFGARILMISLIQTE